MEEHHQIQVETVPGARCRAKITSKASARTHRVILGTVGCVRSVYHSQTPSFTNNVCFLHSETDRHPKKAKKGGRKGSVAVVRIVMQLECEFQDAAPPKVKSILRTGTNSWRPRRRLRLTSKALQSGKKRECQPSLGVIQPTHPHERNFFAPEFEERSHENTMKKERWAHREALDWPNTCTDSMEIWTKSKQHSCHKKIKSEQNLSWIPGPPCTC